MSDSLFGFLGILFTIVSIITYFIGRHQGRKEILDLRKGLREDIVNTANTQTRVRGGGKVKIKDDKIIGSHERGINENVGVNEDVVVVKKNVRNIEENVSTGDSIDVQVKRAKDKASQEN